MAESEDAKREKWRNMHRDDSDIKSDSNRRGGSVGGSKRGAEIYRPGCGLYPKSPRGEPEDNMSSSNSNLYSSSINEKRNQDLSHDGTQNGPSHGQSRGGNGRRSGHSNRARSGRSEKSDSRNHRDRDNKDATVSKLSERLAEVTLKREENLPSNSNDNERTDINNLKVPQNNDPAKKVKKPEQQIYIPKPIAQSMANKEAANKVSNHHKEEMWTDDDSTSYCAEDAGNSQGRGEGRKKKSKKKKRGPRRGEGEKSDDPSSANNKPGQESSSRGGNLASSRSDLSGRQNSGNGSRHDPPRSSIRSDNQPRSGNRSGSDMKGDSQRSSSRAAESVNSRLSQWHDGRSDASRRLGSDPNSMSKSMTDHPRSSRAEDNRHRLDDASLTQSWHADMPAGRNVRLGSEPRGGPQGSSNFDGSRSRDTRSVEPSSWNPDKVQAKPPSGRRGSGKDIPPYNSGSNSKQSRHKDDVPPRFRKKQTENGVKESPTVYGRDGPSSHTPVEKGRYIGTTSEEAWDGSTVTFQGSYGSQSSSNSHTGQYHSLPSMSLPPMSTSHPPLPPPQSHDNWANTMPGTRNRGRGRLRQEDIEMERAAGARRPGGLDSHSSSVESLVYSSRGDRAQEWTSKQHPSSSTPSLSGANASSHSYGNQPLPPPGALRRRLSGGSQGDRSSSGHRTPTGRLTPTNSGNATPVNLPSPSQESTSSQPKPLDLDIIVPEIPDWSEEVERCEQLQGANAVPPSNSHVDFLSSSCQDWNEEVERAEQLQESACKLSANSQFENVPKPSQDVKQQELLHEDEGSQRNTDTVPQSDHFPVMHQDWCEEVERSERLEACAGSEAHTRSSSPVSRSADNVQWKQPVPTTQWKKPRRSSGDRLSQGRPLDSHDRPPSRGGSRDHSVERGGPGGAGGPGGPRGPGPRNRERSLERGGKERSSWRGMDAHQQPAWRREPSSERAERSQDRVWRPAPGLPPRDREHSPPGRSRLNSGPGGRERDRSQELSRREHSPHRNGPERPEPPAGGGGGGGHGGGRHRRGSGRDHSGERSERGGGRHRRNSGRDHSVERRRHGGRDHSHERDRDRGGRHRRNSGRDHSPDHPPRERGGRNRRSSGRDHSRDRRDHSHGRDGGGGGGSRRERMGLEWRHRDREGIDDDWRRPPASKQSPPPHKQAPGILVLPQEQPPPAAPPVSNSGPQRHLYDPNNPSKPIIVVNPSVRTPSGPPSFNGTSEDWAHTQQVMSSYQPRFNASSQFPPAYQQSPMSPLTNQFSSSRPAWYNPYSESFRSSNEPHLIMDIQRADLALSNILESGRLLQEWNTVEEIRKFIQTGFITFVLSDIKFLHKENADQHLWKILYYNVIEYLRNSNAEGNIDGDRRKKLLLQVIDQGTQFFESLLLKLQDKYGFRLDDFLPGSENHVKLTAVTAVATVVAQKIYLFLGDLARYREQANETSNFGKARQWYLKAHQINPKSGRPYNQLAILAVYARRKIDAVYYYMRGLMASNFVVHTARENLLSLFDENRKKYEQTEKKRREEREARERSRMLEKESVGPPSLRREVWYHPNNGQRVSRTTSNTVPADQSDTEEELAKLSSVDLNKRFVMSFMHIHGKLYTKVGMETFQEAALQMLKEFHALLQHSPIPLNANRFLQLLALNMFAIENTQLREVEAGYRSAAQEAALLVSLQMFSVLLERCVSLLRAPGAAAAEDAVSAEVAAEQLVELDVAALLPAIKVWCDWLTCHVSVWNPPPAAHDYHVGPPGDAWTRLASLVNLLDALDVDRAKLTEKPMEGYVQVRLPEDNTLAGFMPLMSLVQEPLFAPRDADDELVHVCTRVKRLLFFGHTFLCGIDPPVLRLHKDVETGRSEYISVAARPPRHDGRQQPHGGLGHRRRQHAARAASPAAGDSASDDDLLEAGLGVDLEEEDGDEAREARQAREQAELTPAADASADEVRALLLRREELERRRRRQERHRKRIQDIIRQSAVEVEIEVRPHFIVPDTNCFVDHLPQLRVLAGGQTFQLMVPVVVVSELEGLSRGLRPGEAADAAAIQRSERVAAAAKEALAFLRQRPGPPSLRCVTTRGSTLASTVCTSEDDGQKDMFNDDKILTTCLNLSRTSSKDESKPGEPRRLVRDVVLLTDDRNLRVKALTRDVPVRELPDFVRWASLG